MIVVAGGTIIPKAARGPLHGRQVCEAKRDAPAGQDPFGGPPTRVGSAASFEPRAFFLSISAFGRGTGT